MGSCSRGLASGAEIISDSAPIGIEMKAVVSAGEGNSDNHPTRGRRRKPRAKRCCYGALLFESAGPPGSSRSWRPAICQNHALRDLCRRGYGSASDGSGSRTHYTPDRQAERKEIRERFALGLHYVGDWHTHPERMATPSPIDRFTISDCSRRSTHKLAGFLLIVVGNGSFPECMHISLHDGGSASGFVGSLRPWWTGDAAGMVHIDIPRLEWRFFRYLALEERTKRTQEPQ